MCLFLALCILALAGCGDGEKAAKYTDVDGHVQFVVEFNTGLFAFSDSGSDMAYYPSNPKLQKEFEYGDCGVKFSAEYEDDRIVYTVIDPSEDRSSEKKTFWDIYSVYNESWDYYIKETVPKDPDDMGMKMLATVSGEEDSQYYIKLSVHGDEEKSYIVSFSLEGETPQIVYEKTDKA